MYILLKVFVFAFGGQRFRSTSFSYVIKIIIINDVYTHDSACLIFFFSARFHTILRTPRCRLTSSVAWLIYILQITSLVYRNETFWNYFNLKNNKLSDFARWVGHRVGCGIEPYDCFKSENNHKIIVFAKTIVLCVVWWQFLWLIANQKICGWEKVSRLNGLEIFPKLKRLSNTINCTKF